jgi:hypothetical protein
MGLEERPPHSDLAREHSRAQVDVVDVIVGKGIGESRQAERQRQRDGERADDGDESQQAHWADRTIGQRYDRAG